MNSRGDVRSSRPAAIDPRASARAPPGAAYRAGRRRISARASQRRRARELRRAPGRALHDPSRGYRHITAGLLAHLQRCSKRESWLCYALLSLPFRIALVGTPAWSASCCTSCCTAPRRAVGAWLLASLSLTVGCCDVACWVRRAV